MGGQQGCCTGVTRNAALCGAGATVPGWGCRGEGGGRAPCGAARQGPVSAPAVKPERCHDVCAAPLFMVRPRSLLFRLREQSSRCGAGSFLLRLPVPAPGADVQQSWGRVPVWGGQAAAPAPGSARPALRGCPGAEMGSCSSGFGGNATPQGPELQPGPGQERRAWRWVQVSLASAGVGAPPGECPLQTGASPSQVELGPALPSVTAPLWALGSMGALPHGPAAGA